MALLFFSEGDDPVTWRAALLKHKPELDFREVDKMGDPAEIDTALVWRPPVGLLAKLPNLRAIFSLAAGVDALLADKSLPPVPICRMVDPSLTTTMSEYVLLCALRYLREFDLFEAAAREGRWDWRLPPAPHERKVGIMGLGVLGTDAALTLQRHGFEVSAWSRTPKSLAGIVCHSGAEGLAPFLADLDILVCLLPLTAETKGILDAGLFARLKPGCRLINVARGPHLVDDDLLAAIERGQIAHATLDVFHKEPLPADHPFWRHPKITVTPHIASNGRPETAAQTVIENIDRLRRGEPLANVVDLDRGY